LPTETREASPANFLIKIESFYKCGIHKYETKEFAAGEYKWRLIIYPNGDDNIVGKEYISVYLAMVDTSSLPANWEVNAVFSIFLLNHNSGNYLSSLGRTRRFQGVKSEWGFPNFISKKIMSDPSNGYLFRDSCVFGAEVFVIKREAVIEYLCLKNFDIPYKRDWLISNFSKLEDVWESNEFSAGGHKWKIRLNPKANGRKHVAIFLHNVGSEIVKASFTICIKDQLNDSEHEKQTTTNHWFTSTSPNWGWPTFMEIATMNDPKKGFIVNDSCLLHIEISCIEDVAQY
ncbi:hypothetical protein MIMGU_mgv1a018766mg, partial [Erythranthe guttata]